MDAVEQISDKTFVKEMRILWQNVEHSRRKWLEELIRAYFSDAKGQTR